MRASILVAVLWLFTAGSVWAVVHGEITTYELKTDIPEYTNSRPVKIDLIVRGLIDGLNYAFPTGQQWDVWITHGLGGEEVWRWSRGKAFVQTFTHLDLKGGESKTYSATWDQRDNSGEQVPEGQYFIFAHLTPVGETLAPMLASINIVRDSQQEESVSVLGDVKKPGMYSLTPKMTIKDAVQTAGGFTEYADRNGISLKGKAEASGKKVAWSHAASALVTPGDTIYVSEAKNAPVVKVLGAVVNQTRLAYKKGMTLMDAISLAGGFSGNSDKSGIIITRLRKNGQTLSLRVNLGDVRRQVKDPKLRPGDVVVVPKGKKKPTPTQIAH